MDSINIDAAVKDLQRINNELRDGSFSTTAVLIAIYQVLRIFVVVYLAKNSK
jgi:hypothetical protein